MGQAREEDAMLEKVPLGGGKVRVTFRMPALPGVGRLTVCGEFNAWDAAATPMTHAPDGSWSIALTFDAGRVYAFRYHDDRGVWHDDDSADGREPNGYGGVNSLVDLR